MATQAEAQDLANMLKPVLTQLASEVNAIKVGVGHTQAGLMRLQAEHEQMRAALVAQGFQLPPAGSAAAQAAPLPTLTDAATITSNDAGSPPMSEAGAASATEAGGWRKMLSAAAAMQSGAKPPPRSGAPPSPESNDVAQVAHIAIAIAVACLLWDTPTLRLRQNSSGILTLRLEPHVKDRGFSARQKIL